MHVRTHLSFHGCVFCRSVFIRRLTCSTHFGDSVFDANGALNRDALGRVIFGDKSKARQLNALLKVPILKEFVYSAFMLVALEHSRMI